MPTENTFSPMLISDIDIYIIYLNNNDTHEFPK